MNKVKTNYFMLFIIVVVSVLTSLSLNSYAKALDFPQIVMLQEVQK